MPADRFYTPQKLFPGETVRLLSPEEVHMKRIMRKKAGDVIELFNGQGSLFSATILPDDSLQVISLLKTDPVPPQIIIAQALLAPSKLDWLTEKCAELGASALWLFPADYSEKKSLSDALLARLHNLAIAAAKQSGRLFLMDILLKPPLIKWPTYPNLFFGSTSPESPQSLPSSFIFAVGPEKGFSPSEYKAFNPSHGISLSPYTLRTETAALVLLSKHL